MTDRDEAIRARCEAAVKELREMLPPKVDYAELVCAEGFTHGFHYVWQDPEPYMIDNAAKLIEELFGEVGRLRADLAAMTAERDDAQLELTRMTDAYDLKMRVHDALNRDYVALRKRAEAATGEPVHRRSADEIR